MRIPSKKSGLTLVEILMVVVVLGIAATVAVSMTGNTSDLQVRAAARELVAALAYAQNDAITRQKNYQIAFDPDHESYVVQQVSDTGVATTINDPVRKSPFTMNYLQNKQFYKVRLESADFGGARNIWFDKLGAPYAGPVADHTPLLNKGQIVLQAGESRLTIEIEPVTGRIKLHE